jgi:murein DD-endopeptidase MepM/ murein hydrolase activator NlpD
MFAVSACGDLAWPPFDPDPVTGRGTPLPSTRQSRPPPPDQSAPPQTARAEPQRLKPIERSVPSVPPPGTVTVARGDTVYGIARANGVTVRGVIDANGLKPPYLLRPGQLLKLPAPSLHTVRAGDTLYGVSRRYGVDVFSLAKHNDLTPPYQIRPGDRLRLPGAAVEPVAIAARAPLAETVPQVESLPPPSDAPSPRRSTAPEPAPASPPLAGLPPGRPANVPFAWPLRGEILSSYGPKGDGMHNDGINIAAPRGAPVRATADGVVAYAGNELRGFGNLLLVKHADGWVTAYGHNDQLLVRRGDSVRQGQVIARVGSTGNVAMPQLHFELRKGTTAVDPRRHLGGV